VFKITHISFLLFARLTLLARPLQLRAANLRGWLHLVHARRHRLGGRARARFARGRLGPAAAAAIATRTSTVSAPPIACGTLMHTGAAPRGLRYKLS
jgi:hypothetical protein